MPEISVWFKFSKVLHFEALASDFRPIIEIEKKRTISNGCTIACNSSYSGNRPAKRYKTAIRTATPFST